MYRSRKNYDKIVVSTELSDLLLLLLLLWCIFVQGRWQPTQSQLVQIYTVDWIGVYDTHNIEHRTEPVSH